MKGVQCYELFGGIALEIHTCSYFFVVLLSFKFHMNVFFLHIVKNSVLFTSYFYIFLLLVVFVFSHSSIPV